MNRKILIGLSVLSVIVLTIGYLRFETKPDSTVYSKLTRLKGFDLEQVKGKYFLIHFWAKWCEPCAEEIPHLIEFSSQAPIQKKLKILAISLDPSLEEARKILPEKGVNLPENFILVLDSEHQVAEEFGSYQYPETYFIGPDGAIIEKWVGAQKWNKPDVIDFFIQKLK